MRSPRKRITTQVRWSITSSGEDWSQLFSWISTILSGASQTGAPLVATSTMTRELDESLATSLGPGVYDHLVGRGMAMPTDDALALAIDELRALEQGSG